jgi:hypothetical protein
VSALSVDEIMEHERRSMGRPCRRLHAHAFNLGEVVVTTVLYESPVEVEPGVVMVERRAALVVNDHVTTSIVVDMRFEDRT